MLGAWSGQGGEGRGRSLTAEVWNPFGLPRTTRFSGQLAKVSVSLKTPSRCELPHALPWFEVVIWDYDPRKGAGLWGEHAPVREAGRGGTPEEFGSED